MALTADPRPDHFLDGAYAPVGREVTASDLPIEGRVPEGLRGTYLRNGPNPMFAPSGRYHLFDGDGMLHGVTFDGGRASYRNRWVRSRGLEAEVAAQRSLYGGMANASFPGPEVVGDAGPMKNVANTNVVRHAGRILCLWEAGPPTEVTAALDTIGSYDFDGRLTGPMTAHPRCDPLTGELLFFGYSAMAPYLRYHEADASGALVRTVDIDLPRPVMMHDFATTAEHVVFLDAPAVFDLASFAGGGPMISWRPDLGARLGVLPRHRSSGDVTWYEIDPCYVFHFMNAYTDGDRIVVDASRLERMDIGLEEGGPADDEAGADGFLTRFTIDQASGVVSTERIGDVAGDFPRVPDARTGLPYRYGYSAGFATDAGRKGLFDTVVKTDVAGGAATVHRFGPAEVVGEAVFVPDPDGSAEDDGWLLDHVYDTGRDESHLVVLDARDLARPPLARIRMPQRVPFGFHGNWLPDGRSRPAGP